MKIRRFAAVALATGAGVGYAPLAPGTVGAVAGAAAAYGILALFVWPPWSLALLALGLTPPAAWSSRVVEQLLKRKDPGRIVIDEIAGQWMALSVVRIGEWQDWVLAILAFRVFDIWKLPPIARLEAVPGGFGVVADDLAAGLCAMIIVAAYRWLPTWS